MPCFGFDAPGDAASADDAITPRCRRCHVAAPRRAAANMSPRNRRRGAAASRQARRYHERGGCVSARRTFSAQQRSARDAVSPECCVCYRTRRHQREMRARVVRRYAFECCQRLSHYEARPAYATATIRYKCRCDTRRENDRAMPIRPEQTPSRSRNAARSHRGSMAMRRHADICRCLPLRGAASA
jgi:hypothetical protein